MAKKLSRPDVEKDAPETAEGLEAAMQSEAAVQTQEAVLRLERARRLGVRALAGAAASIENPETPEPSRLEAVLSSIADQGKFEVYRHTPTGKAKVGIFAIAEWPDRLETIAAQYKGGTFTAQFKDSHGRIRGQDTQTFDAIAYSDRPGSAPEAARDNSADVMDKMLSRMELREESYRRDMQEMSARQSERDMKFFEMLSRTAAPTPAAPATSPMEMMELVKLGMSMAAKPADPLEGIKGVIELMSVMKDGTADLEPKSPWAVALERGLDLLQPIVSVLASKVAQQSPAHAGARVQPLAAIKAPGETSPLVAGGGNPAPARALPLDVKTPEEPVAPVIETNDPNMKEYADKLLNAAAMAVRPSIVAQLVVDSVTAEDVDKFDAMLSDPAFIETLVAYAPKLAAHRTWLQEVLKETKEHFDDAWPSEPEASNVEAGSVIDAPPADAPAPAVDATPAPVSAAVEPAPAPIPEEIHA
jgi:hypothetical protein